ncbi:MAG TPA: efflux RND transporter periplasmic adaptor subunit [Stellaceae bacterium]|nr:efflux RND transporter periplasmic adaptor subunit [Stellaceae bacterium]
MAPKSYAALMLCLTFATAWLAPARAQQPGPGRPPAVGVVAVTSQPVRPSLEFVGRVQSTQRVNLIARVTAFIEEQHFTEGAEVKKGDLLYRLEQPPFQADVAAKQAAIDNLKAQLVNAAVTLKRAQLLLTTPAGQQSNVDASLATQQSLQAQIEGAQAALRQSQINLDYTEIRAPIDGKIGRTSVTVGNVVTPTSGILATIVSQDPMYVVFPVPVRTVLTLRQRFAATGGLGTAVVKIRLPSGELYSRTGKLDFIDNTVSASTDTMTLRGILPNPPLANTAPNVPPPRELVDGELVTVVLEEGEPIEALVIPRAAVLADQRGDYVYVVAAGNKAEQRRVTLGQSTPTTAVVSNGLIEGEQVIVEGVQRVRPGQAVSPAPATPTTPPNAGTAEQSSPADPR